MRAPVPGFAFRPPQPGMPGAPGVPGMPPMGFPGAYPGMPGFAPPYGGFPGFGPPFAPYGAPQPTATTGAPSAPTIAPPTAMAPVASTPASVSSEEKEDRSQVVFVFKEDDESMEEKRAKLRKYRVDAEATKADLSKLSESITQRLKQLQNQPPRP